MFYRENYFQSFFLLDSPFRISLKNKRHIMKKTSALFKTASMAVALLISFTIFNGCKKTTETPTPTPTANEVLMQNSVFSPTTITVTVNTTVKWTNKDSYAHTVTSSTGLFDSGTIAAGGTYSRQFTTVGTFPYKCIFHSNMTGSVIVQ